jgi:hypothetical protein
MESSVIPVCDPVVGIKHVARAEMPLYKTILKVSKKRFIFNMLHFDRPPAFST